MSLHDEWHDPVGVQDVSTATDYISELENGAVEAADYVSKQQAKIESCRTAIGLAMEALEDPYRATMLNRRNIALEKLQAALDDSFSG